MTQTKETRRSRRTETIPRTTKTTITLTPQLCDALHMAISCCHEIGGRNQSDYEIEANAAAAEIERTLQGIGRLTR